MNHWTLNWFDFHIDRQCKHYSKNDDKRNKDQPGHCFLVLSLSRFHSFLFRSKPIYDMEPGSEKMNHCMKPALLSSLAKETFISKLDSRCRFLIFIFRVIRILFRSFRYGSIVFISWELWNSNKEFDFQKDLEINFWGGAIADLDEILVEISI